MPEIEDSWLTSDEGPSIGRSIRRMVEERNADRPYDQSSDEVKELKALFHTMGLDDRTSEMQSDLGELSPDVFDYSGVQF